MDEYISRKDAIKELHDVYEYEYPTASGDFDEYASHYVPNILKNIPAADVQLVKYGKWIRKEGYDSRDNFYYCSECNRIINVICGDSLSNYPYCHCGARMDGEQND